MSEHVRLQIAPKLGKGYIMVAAEPESMGYEKASAAKCQIAEYAGYEISAFPARVADSHERGAKEDYHGRK
jgi:hypothetical protein